MKNLLTLAALTLMASTSFAKSATCELNIFVASKTGLLPSNSVVKIETQVQSEGDFFSAQCSNQNIFAGFNAALCVIESEIVGGYNGSLVLSKNAKGHTSAWTEFATLRKSGKLISLNEVKKTVNQLESAADLYNSQVRQVDVLTLPETLDGDSSQLDFAVERLVKEGLYQEGMPAVVSIKDCQIK